MPLSKPSTDSRTSDEAEGAAMANYSEEMPFLVTHWLANYGATPTVGRTNPEEQEAVNRIRKAASEIASALSTLGAYGTTVQVSSSLSKYKNQNQAHNILPHFFPQPALGSSFLQQSSPKNATYSDLSRKWSRLPASHLESITQAATTTSAVAEVAAANSLHVNLLHASVEASQNVQGRSLQNPIEVESTLSVAGLSSLQPPSLLSSHQKSNATTRIKMTDGERMFSPLPTMEMKSSYSEVAKNTSNKMRQFLSLRERVRSNFHEIKVLQQAVSKQEENGRILSLRFQQVTEDDTLPPTQKLEKLDEIKSEREVSERVVTQLQRKITELKQSHETDSSKMTRLGKEAREWESNRRATVQNFHDPLFESSRKGNSLLHTVLGRQHGYYKPHSSMSSSTSMFRGVSTLKDFSRTRKSLLCTRLSHAATINSHLTYPVYCLRFDRTGRYFVTGADDYLIKVFYLGADQSCRTKNALNGSRQLRCNYGANLRGAVLVTSLRGHAGVINDIDVSADNCFLASASVDGDVRVWGLKDGRPIAVLRGHKGGANMVGAFLFLDVLVLHLFSTLLV